MRDTNYTRNCPPGGWDHYNAERFQEERMERIREEDKKIKGKWMVIRYTKRGPTTQSAKPMSYADAVKEAEEQNRQEFKMGMDGLGEFMGSFKVEKYRK